MRRRLTTNAGASLTRTPRLPSFFVTSQAVASVVSSVASARTSSTSGRTATGLKKCIPTTRSGCSRLAAICVTESEEVFVTSRHSSETTCSSAREDLLLDGDLLEHRLDHEVAAREAGGVVDTADDRAEEARLALARAVPSTPASRDRRGSRRPPPPPVPASTSVITRGTSRRRRNRVASCVAIRPAPTTPTFSIRRGFASGIPTPFLIRRSIRSKA